MNYRKTEWSRKVNKQVEKSALKELLNENETKANTKHLKYESLEMQNYLKDNKNTELSKLIFQLRSGMLTIKAWKPWTYEDNLCVMCQIKEETFDHFFECEAYKRKTVNYHDIFENDTDMASDTTLHNINSVTLLHYTRGEQQVERQESKSARWSGVQTLDSLSCRKNNIAQS